MLNSDVNYREQSKEHKKPKARNGITHTANLGSISDIHATRMRLTNDGRRLINSTSRD